MASISYSSSFASLKSINLDEPMHPCRQTAWLLMLSASAPASLQTRSSLSFLTPPLEPSGPQPPSRQPLPGSTPRSIPAAPFFTFRIQLRLYLRLLHKSLHRRSHRFTLQFSG